jgi:hypothetical protein
VTAYPVMISCFPSGASGNWSSNTIKLFLSSNFDYDRRMVAVRAP